MKNAASVMPITNRTARATRTGRIGVLATSRTLASAPRCT